MSTPEELADRIWPELEAMTDAERMAFLHELSASFCPLCGTTILPCYCAPAYDE